MSPQSPIVPNFCSPDRAAASRGVEKTPPLSLLQLQQAELWTPQAGHWPAQDQEPTQSPDQGPAQDPEPKPEQDLLRRMSPRKPLGQEL
ncbi:hypothetical protein AAFF_G00020020 [Aldrovandia affinis]|uniref:Uncharacterized protein n=1 Tax=Aldrovandia affinis TaxID=143900 RepID=A0AAD7R2J3_9TELE|nr:hypothetical protein AAFF_G00020020 [Aldrovandia affinis]